MDTLDEWAKMQDFVFELRATLGLASLTLVVHKM